MARSVLQRLADLWYGPRPPPYTIHVAQHGNFTLSKNHAKRARSAADEDLLAEKINHRANWFKETPPSTRCMTEDYIETLRDIAVGALAAPEPRRNFPAGLLTFTRLYETPQGQGQGQGQGAPPGHGATGSFTVNLDATGQIIVKHRRGGVAPTEDQRNFVAIFDKIERRVRQLYARPLGDAAPGLQSRDMMIRRLCWAAQIALQSGEPDVKLALSALDGIQVDAIAECGAGVRARYLAGLAKSYGATVALVAIWMTVYHLAVRYLPALARFDFRASSLAYLMIATVALFCGAWLSAANRIEPDKTEVLDSLLSETFTHWVRAAFVLGFGWFALLLLHEQVVVLSFGSVDTAQGANAATGFNTHLALQQIGAAILTGGLLGLAERAVPTAIIQRADNLASALGSK